MKRKVIKLKESDLERLVKRILKEDLGGMDDAHPIFGHMNLLNLTPEEKKMIDAIYNRDKTYKTDDGDLEHGTFDTEEDEISDNDLEYGAFDTDVDDLKYGRFDTEDEDEEYRYRTRGTKPRWMEESEDELSSYKKIMSSKKLKKYKS